MYGKEAGKPLSPYLKAKRPAGSVSPRLSLTCILEVSYTTFRGWILLYTPLAGINVLFDFDVDGDVGVDPDFMTLQFSQAGLGLPAKVR